MLADDITQAFMQMGRIDGYNTLGSRSDAPFAWTDVREMYPSSSSSAGGNAQ